MANTIQRGFTLWLTGLSGSGKSTLATAVAAVLNESGNRVEILDGDDFRTLLSSDLGFSKTDRDQNVFRIAYVARMLSRHGVAVIVAAISPYRLTRDAVRSNHEGPFLEVFVDCSLPELMRRDVKGLYAKAARGEIGCLTGISDPYEAPLHPDIHLRTDVHAAADCVKKILQTLCARGLTSTSFNAALTRTRHP